MDAHAPRASATRIQSDPSVLATTKQLIRTQMAAVIHLSEHNISYLEPLERSWIEHLIGEASAVSGEPQNSADLFLPRPTKMVHTVDSLRESMSVHGSSSRPRGSAQSQAGDDMNILLATSRALNSANSLLSCCYDRWSWFQLSRAKQVDSRINSDGLQELLGRRRQRQRSQGSSPSLGPGLTQLPRRNDTISSDSSRVATTSNDGNYGSENSLSLAVDGTMERWRQNAEDALNETTARLKASGAGYHQSPNHMYPLHRVASRSCSKGHHNSSTATGNDAAAIHASAPSKTFAQQLSLSSSQLSIRHCDPDHTGGTNIAGVPRGSYSRDKCLLPEPFGGYGLYQRPAFQSSLHDSFDKEAIDCTPQGKDNLILSPLPTATLIHSSSSRDLCPAATFQRSQTKKAHPATALEPDPPPKSGGLIGLPINALPTTSSSSSVRSRSTEHTQLPRSRGRRWLERQSDRIATTT